MNYDEAISYIHSICWRGSRPGLSRIGELCGLLGNPQEKLRFIHIAGTNGKGSVSAMLSSVLSESGLRVGTFTSPFIYSFNERMTCAGEPISNGELAGIIEKIKPLADGMRDAPTEFELITAVAFEFFCLRKCEVVVLECGMGGRLDSTNIIEKPLLSIITGVALDHTAYLGDTTEKIAFEKAGIIKQGCPVVVGRVDEKSAAVIKSRAESENSECVFTSPETVSNVSLSLEGTAFKCPLLSRTVRLSLCGAYQPENALVAINAARLLGIAEEKVLSGLAKTKWPARFEVLSREPVVIFDGGHNPQGVTAAVETVKAVISGRVNILTGVMADKDYGKMIELLAPVCKRSFCVTPDNPRALDSHEFAAEFEKRGIAANGYGTVAEAVSSAYTDSRESGTPLLALGSLYMYREVRDALTEIGII